MPSSVRPPFEKTPPHIRVLLWLFIITALFYFHWRIHTLNPDAMIFSSLMLGAEIYGLLTGLSHFMMTWRLTIRKSLPPKDGLTVDIFIPTYNESVDIVGRTIRAAVDMDYPHITWVLDDGNRPEMKSLAAELGAKYLARPTHDHAKAGNLNYALEHSHGEFIAIFDADHVPSKNFITAILGYFSDPNVAFVQTPQDFYNLDSYQHRVDKSKGLAWTEQSLFFKVIQRGKDYWNAAFFCGSCAMVRRSCLNEIGGFATETITEDLHTSIKLHRKGYKSVYHEESLAFGIAPSTIAPFITQRIRWGQGAMQVLKKEPLLFRSGLTIYQKINYLSSVLTYFDGWQKGFIYITPIIVLCTGWLPIRTTGTELLIHLVPYLIVNFLLIEELARGYGRTIYIEQYNMARYFAFAYATLSLFIPRKLKFKVTNKDHNQDTSSHFLWPQKLVFYGNILAIPVGIILFQLGYIPFEGFAISVFWAFFNGLLASSVLAYSQLKQSFKRSSYRFSLPNTVSISNTASNKTTLAVIDDISSDGCRIYGMLDEKIHSGDEIAGVIYFPKQAFSFSATVLNKYPPKPHNTQTEINLGCKFLWNSPHERRELEKYLYGSKQEFLLSSITEKDFTPMEKIIGTVKTNKKLIHKSLPNKWFPLLTANNYPIGVIGQTLNPDEQTFSAILNTNPGEFLNDANIVGVTGLTRQNFVVEDIEKSIGFDYSYYICDLRPYQNE